MLRIHVELYQKHILALLRNYSLLHLWIGEYQRRSLPKVFVAHMKEDVPTLSEKCLVTAFYARKATILQSFNAVATKSNYQHQHVLLRSTAETCSSWFSEEINRQLHTLLPLDFSRMQTVFPRAKITHRLHYEHSHLWVDLLRTSLLWMLSVMNVVWYERGLLRTACMICCERGLLWTWSVMNVVCYEHGGLLWTWSVMNGSVMNWSVMNGSVMNRSVMNGSVMNVVCYEHCLWWMGQLWTWRSVMNRSVMNVVVFYEQVCYEVVCFGVICYECGLLWTWSVMNVVCYERGLLWTWSVMNVVCYERGMLWLGLSWTWSAMTWSVMNRSVMNVVCFGVVCYECGLLWLGLLWTWSVMNVVCYERGLLWM